MPTFSCAFCGHAWIPKWTRGAKPSSCPQCLSQRWDTKLDLTLFPKIPRSKAILFLSNVKVTTGCWLWTGSLLANGYGRLGQKKAHRLAYEWAVGPIPAGMTIDHVRARGCRHRNCVRPAHLEAVPIGVNVLRGDGPTAQNKRKKDCPCGRPLVRLNARRRGCPPCQRKRDREWRMARRRAVGISDRRAGRPPLKD